MTIDYTAFDAKEIKWGAFANQYTRDELRAEAARLYDEVGTILDQSTDADIRFVPTDPDANDPYADDEADQHIGWTIGHLVAHITATNEEAFLFASLLARGIAQDGRIRVETPWEEINTVATARERLEESRRIAFAYLDAFPNTPNLEVTRVFGSERAQEYFGPINALAAIAMGITHHREHIVQIRATLQQAQATVTT